MIKRTRRHIRRLTPLGQRVVQLLFKWAQNEFFCYLLPFCDKLNCSVCWVPDLHTPAVFVQPAGHNHKWFAIFALGQSTSALPSFALQLCKFTLVCQKYTNHANTVKNKGCSELSNFPLQIQLIFLRGLFFFSISIIWYKV